MTSVQHMRAVEYPLPGKRSSLWLFRHREPALQLDSIFHLPDKPVHVFERSPDHQQLAVQLQRFLVIAPIHSLVKVNTLLGKNAGDCRQSPLGAQDKRWKKEVIHSAQDGNAFAKAIDHVRQLVHVRPALSDGANSSRRNQLFDLVRSDLSQR